MAGSRQRARMIAIVTVGLLAWVGSGVTSVASAAPVVTVTPSTDLLDGQIVTITGTAFNPGSTVYAANCPPGTMTASDCDTAHFVSVTADGSGAATIDYQVHRFFQPPGRSLLDCAVAACSIGVTDDPTPGSLRGVLLPVTFADVAIPPATIAVDQTTGLVDGSSVRRVRHGSGARRAVLDPTVPRGRDHCGRLQVPR